MANNDPRPVLALVGGFLGAGKTTLLLRAAALLSARGLKAAIVTNDQAPSLVDTGFAEAQGLPAGEVAGGCFCCRFSDFINAAEALQAHRPDVIFAEPVGSCIDISATILQPLKAEFGHQFRLAPFTVLVDGNAERELSGAASDESMRYLYRHQLAEADLVCATKADTGILPGCPYDMALSARTGEGVAEWLEVLLGGKMACGARILTQIDYGEYARAEAALGWLNYEAKLSLRQPLNAPQVAGPLLDDLQAELHRRGARVAHLKVLVRSAAGYIKAGITAAGGEPEVDGDLTASQCLRHELRLNLRAVAAPDSLREAVEWATTRLPGRRSGEILSSFRPSPPRPERRNASVLG